MATTTPLDDRDVLIDMLTKPKTTAGNTGVSGYGLPGGVETPPIDPVDPNQPGVITTPKNYSLRGFEQAKLDADPSSQSEKYKIGNVMKKYDPLGGVTPEMLNELNALDIAKFSGSGDKLTVENTKNDPRFGKGGTADVVYGYKGQNADTAWQPWFVDDGGAGGSQPMRTAVPGGASSFQTINNISPTDTDFYQRLQDQLAQILGGYSNFDRDALLKQLGA